MPRRKKNQTKADGQQPTEPAVEKSCVRVEKTREYLRYNFTPDELAEFARNMARGYQKKGQLETEEKAVKAQFKSNIDAEENLINDYANKLNNGYEYRNIDCEIRFNDPSIGMKTLVRLDTGEIEKVSAMTSSEMQEPLPFADDALAVTAEVVSQ